MSKLDPIITEQIERLIESAVTLSNEGKPEDVISPLLKAWEFLPLPKEKWDESYHLAKYLAKQYLSIQQLTQAKQWSETLMNCDLERQDSGEREFIAGQIYFESNELDQAKEYLSVAYLKSQGRYFKSNSFQAQSKSQKEKIARYLTLIGKPINNSTISQMLTKAEKEFKGRHYQSALSILNELLNTDSALSNAQVHLLKGKCHFDLNHLEQAADSMTRAYMIAGIDIFGTENSKYLDFLKTKIKL